MSIWRSEPFVLKMNWWALPLTNWHSTAHKALSDSFRDLNYSVFNHPIKVARIWIGNHFRETFSNSGASPINCIDYNFPRSRLGQLIDFVRQTTITQRACDA